MNNIQPKPWPWGLHRFQFTSMRSLNTRLQAFFDTGLIGKIPKALKWREKMYIQEKSN